MILSSRYSAWISDDFRKDGTPLLEKTDIFDTYTDACFFLYRVHQFR